MGKSTINWTQLKDEYIEDIGDSSPYTWLQDVKGWKQGNADSENTRKHTVDWIVEKDELKTKIREERNEALIKAERNMAVDLRKAKHNIFFGVMEEIEKPRKEKKIIYKTTKHKNADGSETSEKTPMVIEIERPLTPKEKILYLESLKTELGEATKVLQNNNFNDDASDIKEYSNKLTNLIEEIRNEHTTTTKTNTRGKKGSVKSS